MRLRLNGWQRIGIVVSLLWVIIAGFAQNDSDLVRATKAYELTFRICNDVAAQHHQDDVSDCDKEAAKTYAVYLEHRLGDVLLVSFVPIPFAWLLAYMLVGLYHWVKRGFNTSA